MRLGQHGVFVDGTVNVDDDIASSGFVLDEDSDATTSSLSYSSENAVEWGWAAGAGVPSGERADVAVTFSRAHAVLFHAYEAVEHRIANLAQLKAHILELDRRAAWEKNRAVIVSVVAARSTTALISSSANAAITCDAKAGAALGSLADPAVGLKLRTARNMHTTVVAEGSLTPLYQALVLRRGVLGGSNLKSALRGADALAADDPLRDAVDEEFALCAYSSK